MTTECIICLQQIISNQDIWINNNTFDCDCYGLYHIECMDKWLSKRPICPICRKFKIFTSEEIRNNTILYYLYKLKICILACFILIIGSSISSIIFYFLTIEALKLMYNS